MNREKINVGNYVHVNKAPGAVSVGKIRKNGRKGSEESP